MIIVHDTPAGAAILTTERSGKFLLIKIQQAGETGKILLTVKQAIQLRNGILGFMKNMKAVEFAEIPASTGNTEIANPPASEPPAADPAAGQ